MKAVFAFAATLALLPGAALAGPQLGVGKFNDYLDAGKSTYTKRIYNSGTTAAFVKVRAWELVAQADGTYQEVPLDDAAAGGQRDLVVSPARLIIPANGMQTVRFVFNGERAHERLFRLRFNPVMPEGRSDFALTAEEAQTYAQSLRAGVQVMAGYGTLLYVSPKNARHEIAIEQGAAGFSVRNTGNATAVLDLLQRCDAGGSCAEPGAAIVRPGHTKHFEKHSAEVYHFKHQQGDGQARRYEIKG
ncbi:molecular chaperone [Pseudomonas typographi]|uniref:molecular chaperone n=1 Tax=Pseudomonas typographi TaxID=2715964 RepID=UPI001687A180|nr:molecular chaperone [Pseudomonas typographi]MBD1589878.1 molecular chaperone [Pseudomonas typographi]